MLSCCCLTVLLSRDTKTERQLHDNIHRKYHDVITTNIAPHIQSEQGQQFNMSSDCPDDYAFSDNSSNAAFIAASVFGVVGMVLNFTIIVSILSYSRTSRHVTTPYIVSCATADFIYSAVLRCQYSPLDSTTKAG